jgi:hypothetical protein
VQSLLPALFWQPPAEGMRMKSGLVSGGSGSWRHGAPPTSPFRLRARRGNAMFWAGLQAPEVHQAPISVTAGRSSDLLLISAPHQKNVSLRRSCGALPPAALRGGGVIPQTPEVLWARLSPHPLQFYAHCLPCGSVGRFLLVLARRAQPGRLTKKKIGDAYHPGREGGCEHVVAAD